MKYKGFRSGGLPTNRNGQEYTPAQTFPYNEGSTPTPNDDQNVPTAPSGGGGFFASPLIQQYLLGAGAGMMNQPTFMHAIGGGVQGGSAAALDEIKRKQMIDAENAKNVMSLMSSFAKHKNEKAYEKTLKDQDDAATAKSYVPFLEKAGIDTSPMNPTAIIKTYEQLNQEQFKPKDITTSFNPITGEMVQSDKRGNLYGTNGSQLTGTPQVSAPTTAPTGWSNGGLPAPSDPKQALQNYTTQLDIAQKAQEKQNQLQADKLEAAKQFAIKDQSYGLNQMSVHQDLASMEQALEADHKFQSTDPIWSHLPDSQLVNETRAKITADPNLGVLTGAVNRKFPEKLQQLSEAGGSSKSADSNVERAGLMATIMDVNQPYEAKKQALARLRQDTERATELYKKNREHHYGVLGQRAPGLDGKGLSMPTGNKPIGSTGMLNGKRVRVIGKDQVEEI